jgi:hypothetical protein
VIPFLIHLSAWKVNSPKFMSNILHSLTPMRAENGQWPRLAAYCQYKNLER